MSHAKYQQNIEKGWYDVAQRVKAILANKDKNDVAVSSISIKHLTRARYKDLSFSSAR